MSHSETGFLQAVQELKSCLRSGNGLGAEDKYSAIWHTYVQFAGIYDRLRAGFLLYSIKSCVRFRGRTDSLEILETMRPQTLYELGLELLYSMRRTGPSPDTSGQEQEFQQIKTYILLHINDPQLTLSSVCRTYHISQAKLNKLFGKYEGQRPLDFVHLNRLRSAKQLLRQGMCVSQAAARVGYNGGKALNRVFKHYEGMTPGAYKSLAP